MIPTYVSGMAAETAVEGRPGVSEFVIETHKNAALLAFLFQEVTGLLAWLGLWQFHQSSRIARWNRSAILLLSTVTVLLIAVAANLGGEIRHEEIRDVEGMSHVDGSALAPGVSAVTAATAAIVSANGWIHTASVANFVNNHTWVWPTAEIFHFIGLCLLFGVVLVVNLRMLGTMRGVPFAAFHSLLPLGMLGLGSNLITGMLFFIALPDQYTRNLSFHWKIVCLVMGGLTILYYTVFDESLVLRPQHDPSMIGKAIAASGLILWLGVLYFGRMLPYIGNSF